MGKTAQMIGPDETLTDARKADVRSRVSEYLARWGIPQKEVAQQCACSNGTVSDVLRGIYAKRSDDTEHLRRFNNWMELDARRRNIVHSKEYVEHAVAREIITVAEIVSETCGMGVIYGPARIGKSFTLSAIAESERLGKPLLVRLGESTASPKAVCRMVCAAVKLPTSGPFDALMRRLVKALKGTKRLLMFDEVDACSYRAVEWVRELHDRTGCPVLLAGKPALRVKLGVRYLGDFSEVTDQLAGRIVIQRDLTERTRSKQNPEPLFSKEDLRQLIQLAGLELPVSRDAVDWLHARACTLGMGGFGMAKVYVYLAYKIAVSSGAAELTAEHLDRVQDLVFGTETTEEIENVIADPASRRIRRLA